MNTTLVVVEALAVGICLGSAIAAWRYYRLAVAATLANRKALDLSERQTELEDDITSVRQSLKMLHSRAGMRELRERRGKDANGSSNEPPDWQRDPEGFRAWAREAYGVGPGKSPKGN